MRSLLIVFFLLLSTGLGFGQPLRVQTGDHTGFTRLVISIGADREWEIIEQDDRTYSVRFDPAADGFDTSTAFDLIQRSRLADLGNDEELSLLLACACEVSSFRHQGEYLVIDIADADPNSVAEPSNQPVVELDASIEEARRRAAEALPDLAALLLGANQLPQLNPTPEEPPTEEQPTEDPVEPEVEDLPQAPNPNPPNPRLAEAAEIMAEQLARAAASGLLDASIGQPQTFADPVDRTDPAEADTEPPESTELGATLNDDAILLDTPSPHQPEDELPVRAHTALDPAISFDTPLTPSSDEQACSSRPFDARDWSEFENFDQSLGELRANLYDERDNLLSDGAEGLALHYLYFGFGAEARYWLMQLPEPSEEYLHIADLIDGAETAPFDPVTSTADCAQGELLWRYLAGAVEVDLNSDDLAAIQRAYSELPVHLRDLIGPKLARALHADRHGPAARNVRDVLNRGGRVPEAELRLLDLDLNISLAMSEEDTRDVLGEMLANSGSDAVDTMAQALAFDRNSGIPPTRERLTAAEALLREAGNGPQTDLLWQEVLLGYAAQGEIDAAISMLDAPDRTEAAQQSALTALISERVAVQDTTGLLILAHTFGAGWQPEGSEAGRAQVGAIALLRSEGMFDAAQILSDVRRPLVLPARPDLEANPPDPVALAWENADWSELSELANGPHADVASRMLDRAESSGDPEIGPQDLTALSGAVDDSRSLREAITGLLQRPSPN